MVDRACMSSTVLRSVKLSANWTRNFRGKGAYRRGDYLLLNPLSIAIPVSAIPVSYCYSGFLSTYLETLSYLDRSVPSPEREGLDAAGAPPPPRMKATPFQLADI